VSSNSQHASDGTVRRPIVDMQLSSIFARSQRNSFHFNANTLQLQKCPVYFETLGHFNF